MDLSAWLLRRTPPRPLVVTTPGGTAARLAVERVMRTRGWQAAMSPAEANILVVAGPSHALEPHVHRVWAAFPAPRARVDVVDPAEVPRLLDSAVEALHDVGRQREQAAHPAPEPTAPHHDMAHDHHEHQSHEHQSHEHQSHEHHGHDMGGMDMPGGIPMADRADDRDGIKLDQLRLPLGPALPLWPAGLVVHTRLQGDVIQDATVEVLSTGHGSFWDGTRGAARALDSSARLLDLAGWADAAARARLLRDETLDEASPAIRAWAGRVRRSRTLRWLLAGVGAAPSGPHLLDGDALTRLYRWVDAAEEPSEIPGGHETQWIIDALPALLEGTELAGARLVVASLDPDLDLIPHTGAHHG